MYVCACLAKENSVLQHLSPLLITAQQPIMTIRWDSVAKAYIKVTEEWGKRDLCASFLDWEAWMFIQSYGDFDWQTSKQMLDTFKRMTTTLDSGIKEQLYAKLV